MLFSFLLRIELALSDSFTNQVRHVYLIPYITLTELCPLDQVFLVIRVGDIRERFLRRRELLRHRVLLKCLVVELREDLLQFFAVVLFALSKVRISK